MQVFHSSQGSFKVTFSSGLVRVPVDHANPEEMINKADQAMYNAKQNGRDQTVIYKEGALAGKLQMNLRIIIVVGIYMIRRMLSRHFKDWTPNHKANVVVSEYANSESFLRSNWYYTNDLHVILLDIEVSNPDEIQILQEIRNKYSSDNVIIVILTARDGEFDVVRAIEFGVDDYIAKPFEIEGVSSRVQGLLSRRFE